MIEVLYGEVPEELEEFRERARKAVYFFTELLPDVIAFGVARAFASRRSRE